MKSKITQEFLASELQISRSVISKALRNQPGVAESTRQLILDTAQKHHYLVKSESASSEILFICPSRSFDGIFWTTLIKEIDATLSEFQMKLRLVLISPTSEQALDTDMLTSTEPDGIIMAGPFESDFYRAVAALGIPMVAQDISIDLFDDPICDIVCMRNYEASFYLTEHLIKKGYKRIAFAGIKDICYSFFKRWDGYCAAMRKHNLPMSYLFSAKHQFQDQYTPDVIYEAIKEMPELPDAFVCANDSIASRINYMCFEPYNVYDSIGITGFDNSAQYINSMGTVSTVEIFPDEIGKCLAEQICWRIQNPQRKFKVIFTFTKTILK